VSLWDLEAPRPPPVSLRADDRTNELAWSPDGRLLAVTGEAGGAHGPSARDQRNQNVTLWDVATRTRVGDPLLGHEGGVIAAAFSPDGATLASGDFNGGIRLWDVQSRSPLGQRIVTGPASVNALRFSADGRTLASGHGDGQVRLWELTPDGWIDRLCTAAHRNLTEEEWAEFVGDVEHADTCPEAGS
jgi:WD40 repeat protein